MDRATPGLIWKDERKGLRGPVGRDAPLKWPASPASTPRPAGFLGILSEGTSPARS
jgi:hypothetical protein